LNAANHPDFSGATIDANINSATFGRVTGGSGARIIVLGARLKLVNCRIMFENR
jgi:hypothetical protein